MLTASTDEVAAARVSVAAFVLPPCTLVPQGVPVTELMPAAPHSGLVCSVQAMGELLSTSALADLASLRQLCQQALGQLPTLPLETVCLNTRSPAGDPVPHDAYFLLVRHEDEPGLAYLHSLVVALHLFLEEVRDAGEFSDYAGIARSLTDLLLAALDAPDSPYLRTLSAAPGATTMLHRAAYPVRRWLRGHQLFAAITQGLVWTLHTVGRASDSGDEALLQRALLRMTSLYQASADAFRFTADFDPWYYTNIIRPSMCEPHVPAGFSGTLSVDHAHLVRLLSSMGPVMQAARSRFPDLHDGMRAALSRVYADHRWVCERFDGADQPSLRTDSHHGSTSATEMLERFHQRRLWMLSPARPA